jgi:phosphatidylglycerophosphate synthase
VADAVYRPLAHLVVVPLLRLRVPPPAVVVAAGLAGIAAAVALAGGNLVAAAALVVLKTILDNADGQLARLSGRVTPLGRYLDSESDLLVDAALFAALGSLTGSPLLASASFLALMLVLGANFNLRRLYEGERGPGPADPMPAAAGGPTALARRIYGIVYAPQDRLFEWHVERRLAGRGREARLAYHDRGSIALLHNLGLSTQLTVFALCLAAGAPTLAYAVPLLSAAALVPLEVRRGLRAARADLPFPRRRYDTC